MMPQIADLVRQVAAGFPDRRIVVRPHPVEDARYWEKVVQSHDNVTLRADGALTEWLGGAAAMVYISGCGAGFEAYLANVPAVRFEGDGRAAVPQSGISSAINVPARTPTQAVEALRAMLSGDAAGADRGGEDHRCGVLEAIRYPQRPEWWPRWASCSHGLNTHLRRRRR